MSSWSYLRRVERFAGFKSGKRIVGSVERPLLLDGVGLRVWELFEYAMTLDEICEQLVVDFRIDEERCRADTAPLIAELQSRDLLQVAPVPNRDRDRYLGLLKRALVNLIYIENEQRLWLLSGADAPSARAPSQEYLRDLRYLEPDVYAELAVAKELVH